MDLGTLVGAIIILAILGCALSLLFHYVPIEAPIKTLIVVIVVLFVVLWLLRLVGIVPKFG